MDPHPHDEHRPQPPLRTLLAPLLAEENRGLLLDVVVFAVNIAGMALLVGVFEGVVRRAAADDRAAQVVLFALAAALFVLPPLGATLKRWHHHQRGGGERAPDPLLGPAGCVFSPIFYLSLIIVIFAVVNAFILQQVYGRREPPGTVFATSILLGIVLIIVHTVLVYRYFSPPQRPPRSAFLRGRASAIAGDVCLFTNMLLFQVIWNSLSFAGIGRPGGVVDALLRLCVLVFLALLLYFPPRMFYLADDIDRPRTWGMILLANAPVIARMLFGSST